MKWFNVAPTIQKVEAKPTKASDLSPIKDYEGLRLYSYLPTPRDKWTIGWGHTEGVHKGMYITEEQAEKFLREDVEDAEEVVLRLVLVPLTQNQFDSLVSFVFNIGEAQFRTSTLLRVLNKGNYEEVPNQLLRWNKQDGRVLAGLVSRRAKERELWLKNS
jgi:lysozyme